MIKVLLTNFHPNGGGGHVTYIETLTALNNDNRYRVGVATPETSRLYQLLKKRDFKHLFACDFPAKIQKELPDIIRSIRNFRQIVKQFRPDIIHANGGADLFIVLWSHLGRRYSVVRTHHAIKGLSNDFLHRYIYRKIICRNVYVSNESKFISQSRGVAPENSLVIRNGVDISYFAPAQKNGDLLNKLGIDDDTICFGSCAGFGQYKRIDLIIDAALRLKDKYKFHILVLGEEAEGKRLQRQARKMGLNNFTYCGFHSDVRPFVSLFDVGFVLSDSIETLSIAAREMLSMGKPLLSSSFSGLKENIIDGENGFLVRPGNLEDVVTGMKKFLEMTSEERQAFSISARTHAENNFDVSKQLEQHRILYSGLKISAENEVPWSAQVNDHVFEGGLKSVTGENSGS